MLAALLAWKLLPWLVVVHSSAQTRSRVSSGGVKAMTDKDLYGGLIRLHILHHAAAEPIFGLGIIEELRHHGYEMSAGTLYPMLHGLENRGYLISRHEHTGRRGRRVYEITEQGRTALADAKTRVRELFGELIGGH